MLDAERAGEQAFNRPLTVRFQRASPRAREVCAGDEWRVRGAALLPVLAGPREPAVPVLIEHVQLLVAQFRELRAPSRAAADGAVLLHGADDVNLLTVVDLIPDRLEDFSNRGRIGVAPVHQA